MQGFLLIENSRTHCIVPSLSLLGIGGVLPTELGELTQLEILDLSKNKQVGVDGTGISGGIPAEIGNLKLLTTLVLFENRLTGELVPFLLWISLYSLVKCSAHVESFLFFQFQVPCPLKLVASQN